MIAVAIAVGCVHVDARAEESPDAAQAKKPAQTGDAATPAPVIDKIDVKPGDRWTYQVIDDVTGDTKSSVTHTVTEIRGPTYSVQSTFTPYGQTTSTSTLQIFDDKWNLVEDQLWMHKPANPSTGIQLPLKVGAQWKTHLTSNRKMPPDSHFTTEAITRVVAYEPVMLKFNKTYDAFKIEVDQAVTSSANPASTVTVKATMWYAPSINRYVKRIVETRINDRLQSRGVELLTAYVRRHDDD